MISYSWHLYNLQLLKVLLYQSPDSMIWTLFERIGNYKQTFSSVADK